MIAAVDPSFTNTATVRTSTAELRRTGGDTSGVECYTCHERGKTLTLHFTTTGTLRLPKEHEDLVLRHGHTIGNNLCFNCHAQTNLEALQVRDGRLLPIDQSTLLCGSCHGPTYRDWQYGVHGRTSGYWNRAAGPVTRADCVSCHDPHSPAFAAQKPAPPPRPVPAAPAAGHAADNSHRE